MLDRCENAESGIRHCTTKVVVALGTRLASRYSWYPVSSALQKEIIHSTLCRRVKALGRGALWIVLTPIWRGQGQWRSGIVWLPEALANTENFRGGESSIQFYAI